MKLTMPQNDNDVIRYLMKEMDPSEEVLMERAMMEDDDLLIEVESMRQTMRRLNDMPEKKPPQELTNSIVKQAAEVKNNTRRWPTISSEMYKYAAVLLIGMGIGSGAWFIGSPYHVAEKSNKITIPAINLPAQTTASSKTSAVKPWVDKDDIIYFQDKFSPKSSSYKAILKTSMEKLTPVDDQSLINDRGNPNIHLTGARQ